MGGKFSSGAPGGAAPDWLRQRSLRALDQRLAMRARRFMAEPNAPLWVVHLLIWLSYFLLQSLLAASIGSFWWNFVLRAGITLIGFVLTLSMAKVLRGFRGQSVTRIVLASLGLSVAASTVFTLMDFHLFLLFNPQSDWRPIFPRHYIQWFGINLYVFLAWTAMHLAIGNYVGMKAQRERAMRAHALAHEAQLKMLRYQINPHFLFNTLNALSTLVLDKANRQADQTITHLSKFLRYALDNEPAQKVTLSEELEAMNLYLEIERVRFADRLRIKLNATPEARRCAIPSLLLQPLIENAVKYAVTPREEGGRIELDARVEDDRLVLVLTDDGPGISESVDTLMKRPGIGLANTRDRLEQLYEGQAAMRVENGDPHGLSIEIRLPCEEQEPET
ncbi:MAG: sensor histidine kinase [Alphaproteobacteria bacterium]